ncbi:high-affinity nickel-transport protein-domain-containing protein [Irpex rosettiformis]|uniref:High-affinity nickel-transport protein-domain-containing protein n=1 Tax=Irpex rosettiformis TaxID=378272 RepID=A0ACB8U0C5_9APHY|nr:high-affinity nickel-transport protein-domain-containing protein [Irpex rosettiformis]
MYNIRLPRLTLFGRSVLLLGSELLANAICWIVAGILFGRNKPTRPILSLALLAWTIGLRHALDADHISAIDNATRSLIGLGQLPVTCGLFFSLGHSSIVIAVNIAIAISTSVYEHIDGVGTIGSIVGTAVSGSFLFIIGLANSIILFKVLKKQRRIARGEDIAHFERELEADESRGNTLTMRIIGPIVTFVNRPWKMYPVGILFGFGFDTASSIALLATSAIAKKDSDGKEIPASYIVILPFLFTAGMTLIDSVDSIIMLYSYAGFPDRSFAIFERRVSHDASTSKPYPEPAFARVESRTPSKSSRFDDRDVLTVVPVDESVTLSPGSRSANKMKGDVEEVEVANDDADEERERLLRVKRNAMSNLSILLTLMSILVAFTISLIEIMGLIGDNCTPCQNAANAPDGGGLAGSWWRGWGRANDLSGYIGAAIVGAFVVIVASSYGLRYAYRMHRQRRTLKLTTGTAQPTTPTELET